MSSTFADKNKYQEAQIQINETGKIYIFGRNKGSLGIPLSSFSHVQVCDVEGIKQFVDGSPNTTRKEHLDRVKIKIERKSKP